MRYPGSIFDVITVYNSNGDSEELIVELPYGVLFGAIETILFGLTESVKIGEKLSCREGV